MNKNEITIEYNYETDPDEVLERALTALLSMWKYKFVYSTDGKPCFVFPSAQEITPGYTRRMKFAR